ncbi:hypothetical protein JHW43_007674 [Diplocarpon mali]|nr:hypothetical protein JHW43_007674 [Diplocarpon mali]
MASVQNAPAVQQPGPPQTMPSKENMQIYLQKYKQMKESGVSEKDPEYQKIHQYLATMQQQRLYQQQRMAYAQQQQQQQQMLGQQNAASSAANGTNGTRTAPAPVSQSTTQAPTSLGPSAIPATASLASTQKGGVQRTAPSGSGGYFSPEQLGLLKQQIFAFKCLSKNQGIPQTVQQQLFASQKKSLLPTENPLEASIIAKLDDAQPNSNGAEVASGSKVHEYLGFEDPRSRLMDRVSYSSHKHREARPMIPSILPSGVNIEKARRDREIVIHNRMVARLAELRNLPGNLAHLETRSDELTIDDTVKRKALIEMKMLGLFQKQRIMREKIGRQMIQYDNLAMTANRTNYRRMKKQTLREARITEKLEKQQRDARETRDKKKHVDYLNHVINHAREVNIAAFNQRKKIAKLGAMMQQQHQNIEKEEQKRIERTAKQRLQALKSNDEEAYLKLLDQAKDTRITHLLRQTDGFLSQLASSVKEQQRKAAERYGNNADEFAEEESEEEEEEEEQDTRKIDYYAVAHRIKEEVHKQPSILWAPALAKVVYKGPPAARKQQQSQIRYGNFQVLLTTYEYIIKDRPILSKIKWIHMIIDEGHRMKNASSKLSATLTQYYNTRYRLILTGTPLQNNLPELWALLNFVLPTIFKSVKSFDEWFNTPFANTGGQDKMELTEEEQILVIRRLHKVLRPFLLRRLKKDVEKDLPDKTEKVIKCKFSSLQARLYKQMVTHNKLVVSDGKGGKTGARGLSNMIMQLRKLCNHPFVFDEVENQMNPLNTSNDLLWRTAGKFELLDRVLPKYQATGHRVLMFFQMTAIMDIMEDFLRYRGILFMRLDGTTKSDDRSDLLREFNAPDSPYFMFLLSTRAGGLGLNLQTADTVIIYDSDWNPHQDLQAQDRAHRIGQKNEVRILRLISSNSVEEKILERAKFKLDMDGKVIQAGRFDNKSSETDRDAMLRVMLETAEAAEALEQEEMDDEDLNMILARSDDELEIFRKMDIERAKDPTYGTGAGSKRIPRLMAESELPEIYMSDGNPISDEPEEVKGRGARERTRVKYDDGLTEEQWLQAVDDDEDTPEAAAARKLARKDRRENNRLKRAGELPGSIENSPEGSRESTEELPEPEPTPKKGRGRKAAKNEKRKAEDLDEEPPAKRKRAATGRASKGAASTMSAQHRNVLQSSLRRIYDTSLTLQHTDSNAEDSDGEPPTFQLVEPFLVLVPKKDFPTYYTLISQPIALKMIEKKIKKEEYSSLGDFMADIRLMCSNAKKFNEDSSIIYKMAVQIEREFESLIRDEISEHPELGDDEAPRNGGSTAPTTNAGTPNPASAQRGRNKPSTANGGSSGLQSDDD